MSKASIDSNNNKSNKKHKGLIILIISVCTVIVLLIASFFIYFSIYYKPNEYAKSCMISDDYVSYKQENNRLYYESKAGSNTSIIFYGGGKTHYESYAPLGYNLAKRGVNVVICSSPYNMPLFNVNEADNVIGYKENQEYYIMGHSLGGVTASMYIKNNYSKLKGLILLGSYSYEDLSSLSIKCLSIRGSNDLLCPEEKVISEKKKLPVTSTYVTIEGGNHAYFGAYGEQKGDGVATITNKEQVEITADFVSNFI